MRITITCPRCKRSMSAASKLAGSYVTCPHCDGRFWVPEAAVDEPPQPSPPPGPSNSGQVPPGKTSTPVGTGTVPTGSPLRSSSSGRPAQPIPQAPPPPGGAANNAPPAVPPTPPAKASPPPLASPAARPGKKVARFITAEAAQSTLEPAEDGKLPELHLQESAQAKSKQEKGVTIHPLVLLGLVCLSVVACVLLVLYEPEQQSASHSARIQQARRVIETEYFANLEGPGAREPYQRLLREAQRAYARGDRRSERRLYRRVLELLRAERSGFEGVTGSRTRDERLEEQITILLSDD